MKLSDFVMEYLHSKGSRHIFGVSGGAAVHLFDSASKHSGVGASRPIFSSAAAAISAIRTARVKAETR